jgi:2,3-bisphosphoglycerate-dependent phosphoglycerate mutase
VVGDFSPLSFMEAKQKLFENYQDAFPEGESSMGAQDRAIKVILKTLKKYEGKKIVIGTHGDIITLIMNYFDKQYGYQFWQTTTMLDIYKLIFKDRKIISMTRL